MPRDFDDSENTDRGERECSTHPGSTVYESSSDFRNEIEELRSAIGKLQKSLAPTNAKIHRSPTCDTLLAFAKRLYEDRRDRANFLDPAICGEPGWDLLLDLYASSSERSGLCVTTLCFGAGLPTTTGLRWLNTLTEAGYIFRYADPNDGRRTLVELTAEGHAAISAYLRNRLERSQPLP